MPSRSFEGTVARCPASGSIGVALERASELVRREFCLSDEVKPFDRQFGRCAALRERWREWTALAKSACDKRKCRRFNLRGKRLHWALKSCDRLFDAPCKPCDAIASCKARQEWLSFMTTRVTARPDRATYWSGAPLELLANRVRELLGSDWAKNINGERAVYVPDQQGCREARRVDGGTFSVHPSSFDGDCSLVRVGTAKTKGKNRVVTMQPAAVKEALRPIHDTLYDYISSFGWCVRGDVTKADFERISDDRVLGEDLVSGDYEAATNNIYQPAVNVIVDVLCESRHLTDIQRSILRKSFTDLRCQMTVCPRSDKYPILRGSMMGNLCSFPILCLLNKACYDICRDFEASWGDGKRDRKVRINGDDIMFAGTRRFYNLWIDVTGHFGLTVNKDKTGRDSRFLELNSRSYDCLRHRFVAKPVLSFLAPSRNHTGDLLSEVVKGMSSFSHDVLMYVVNDLLRYEISVRPISLENIPTWLWRSLVKRKWFRVALKLGPLPVEVKGVQRTVPMVVADPPRPRFYPLIDSLYRDVVTDHVNRWLGVKVKPPETRLDRSGALARRDLAKRADRFTVSRSEPLWAFTWPAELYNFLRDNGFDSIFSSKEALSDEWFDEHPWLVTRSRAMFELNRPGSLSRSRLSFSPPACFLTGVMVADSSWYESWRPVRRRDVPA